MNFLEARILKEGHVNPGGVLKVDSFLNHQIDVALIDEVARELKRRFADKPINKVLTIESSGIAIACAVARELGVPMVYAKKTRSVNIDGEAYVAEVESFTQKKTNMVIVSKKFLTAEDHVLIVDDFLANGCALQGLISLVEAAEGTVEGLGIAIEKGFQDGGYRLRNLGYHLESIAIIQSMDDATGEIVFAQPE
jgi:xanthine phosphoribosyltransferase